MNQRFYSLDIFRGATVALMILVNNPGSWSHIHAPLEHAAWHGCTPTDLVFPFFLFAVGNAMAFTMPRLHTAGTAVFLRKVFRRSVLIFAIGLVLNWSPFIRWEGDQLAWKTWDNIRIFGVLQRIALCYLFASLLVYFLSARQALVASFALLILYWVLCVLLATGDGDLFNLEGFWGTHVDRTLLRPGHIYKGEGVLFDPEGLVSTMTAIVQVVAGYFTGRYIRQRSYTEVAPSRSEKEHSLYRIIAHLFVAGGLLAVGGLGWGLVFPINKKIWTSSYVLYTTGLAVMILATAIYFIEIRGYKGWLTRFFEVFGKNPLFIFVLSGILPRLLGLIRIPGHTDADGGRSYLSPFGWFYEHICKPAFANLNNGSLLYAVSMIIFYWLIVYWLDKKNIYIRV